MAQDRTKLVSIIRQMEADGVSEEQIRAFVNKYESENQSEEEVIEDPIDESVEKPEELVAEDATAVPGDTELASDDGSLESPVEVVEDTQEQDQYASQIEAQLINDFNKGISKRENQAAYDKFHETGVFDATLLGSETQSKIEADKVDHAKILKIREDEGDDAYYAALKEKQEEDALGDGIFNNKLSRSFFQLFERNRLQGTSGGNENIAVRANERIKNLESVKDSWDPEEWEKEMTKTLAIKNANDYLSYEKFDDAREFERSSAHGKKQIDFVNEDGSWNWGKIKAGALDGTLYSELITQLPNTVIAGIGKSWITAIPGKIFFSAQMANEYRTSLITEKLDGEFGAGKWGQQEYTKFIHENQDLLREAKLYGIGAGQVDRFVDRLTTRGFGSSSIGGKLIGKAATKLAPAAAAKAAKASKAIKAAVKGPLDKIMKTAAGKVLNNRLTRFAGGLVPETIVEMETEQLQEEIGKALISKSETGQNVASRAFERQANWHFGGKTLYSPEEIKEIGNLRAITGLTAGVMTGGGKAYRGAVEKVKELSLSNQGRDVSGKPMTREDETALRPTESVEANKADIAEAKELNNTMEQTQDPEMKAELLKGIGEKITAIETRNLNNKEVVSRLTSSEISDIQGAKENLTKWDELIGNESVPVATREIAEKKIAELNDKVDTIYKRPIARALIKKEVDTEQVDEKRRLSDVQSKINELPNTPESAEKYKELKKKEKGYKDELDKGDLRYQIIPNDPQTELDSVRKLRASRYIKNPSMTTEESLIASKTFTGDNREKANLKISGLIQDKSISGSMRSKAINELIENNVGIIKQISNKYAGRTRGTNFGSAIEKGDIESKITQEILTKAQTYNPKSGAKFGTWLLSGLDKKVGNYVTNESGAIRTNRRSKTKNKVRISTQQLVEDSGGFSAEESFDTGYFEDEDTGSYTGASAGGAPIIAALDYDSRDVSEDFIEEDSVEFDEDINAPKAEKTADDYLSEYDDNYENDKLGDEEFNDDFDAEEALEDSYNSERRKPKETKENRSSYTKEDYSVAVAEAVKSFYGLKKPTIDTVKDSIVEGLENDTFPDFREGDRNISTAIAKQAGVPISKSIDKLFGKTQEDKVKYLSENNEQIFALLPEWAQSGKVFGGLFQDGNPGPEVWENYFGTGGKDGARKIKKFRNALTERVTDILLEETLEENLDLSLVHADYGMDKTTYQVYRKGRDKDLIKGLSDRLKSAWPGVEVIDTQVEVDEYLKNNPGIPDNVGGFYYSYGGVILVNPSKMGNDTILHEFSHMWLQGIKKSNRDLWNRGAELIQNTPEYKGIVETYSKYEQYANDPELMLEEGMAQLIGLKGTEIFKQESKAKKWDNFVSSVKNWVNKIFGGSVENNLADMKLNDFIKHATVEIISGKSVEGAILGNKPEFEGGWVADSIERSAEVYQQRAGIEEAMKNPEVLEKLKPILKTVEQTIAGSNAMMDVAANVIDLPSGAIKVKTKTDLVDPVKTLTDWFKVLTAMKPEHRMLIVNSLISSTRPNPAPSISAHLGALFTQKPVLKQAVINAGIDIPGVVDMISNLEEIQVGKHTVVAGGITGESSKIMRSIVDYLNKGQKVVEIAESKNKLRGPASLKSLRKTGGKVNEAAKVAKSNEKAAVQRDILREIVDGVNVLVKDGSIDETSARRLMWGMAQDQSGLVRSAVKMEYYHKDSDTSQSTVEHVIPASAFIGELVDETFGHNRPEVKQAILDNYVGVNLNEANDKMLAKGEIGLLQNTVAAYDPASNIFKSIPDAYARYMNDKVFINPFDLISYADPNVSLATEMGLDPSLEAKFAEAVKNVDNAPIMYQIVDDNPGSEEALNSALKDAKAKNDLRKDRIKALKKLINDKHIYKTSSPYKKSRIDSAARKKLNGMKLLLAITEDFNTEDTNSLILEAENIIKAGRKAQRALVKGIQEGKTSKEELNKQSKDVISDATGYAESLNPNQVENINKKKNTFLGKLSNLSISSLLAPTANNDFLGLVYDMFGDGKNRDQNKDFLLKNLEDEFNENSYEYDEGRQMMKNSFNNAFASYGNNGNLDGLSDSQIKKAVSKGKRDLNSKSGIIINGDNLTKSQIVRVFNHLKDPSLWAQMKDGGITNEIAYEVASYVNNDPKLSLLASNVTDIYGQGRKITEGKLVEKGFRDFDNAIIDKKNLNEQELSLLNVIYNNNIPDNAPYSPFSAESDQSIDFEEDLRTSKTGNLYSVMSTRLKERNGKGTYLMSKKDLATDLNSYIGAGGPLRSAAFLGFAENASAIFDKENMSKLEAKLGKEWGISMRDSLRRIITGTNRRANMSPTERKIIKYMNGTIASIMWFNTRSYLLQHLSFTNFMLDEPKAWKFMGKIAGVKYGNNKEGKEIMKLIENTGWFQERAEGGTDLAFEDIFNEESDSSLSKLRNELHRKGYALTKYGDRAAILRGGIPFIMGRTERLMEGGMTKEAAQAQAVKDFIVVAKKAQQSNSPELLGRQQVSILGRAILAFANTPQQYNRLISKSVKDLKHAKTDAEKGQLIAKIAYYAAVQNAIFTMAQTALFTLLGVKDLDDEDEEKAMNAANSMLDTLLRGSGIAGALLATFKNLARVSIKNKKKTGEYFGDEDKAVDALANTSPALGTLIRKIKNLYKPTYYKKSNNELSPNEWVTRSANALALTNIPADRLLNKFEGVSDILAKDLDNWQKVMRIGGWSRYSLDANVKDNKGRGGFDTKFDNKKSSFDRIK